MGRGRVTPDETIEQIKATYALNGNARETSRVTNTPLATVLKYVDPETKDEFDQVRSQHRLSVIEEITRAQIVLIHSITEPARLKKATLSELSNTFATVTEKGLLLAGQATSITGTVQGDPLDRLSVDDIEQLQRLRQKLADDGGDE